ncbi:MAG: MFS transporter, partial [Dehalococcoidia bacterium]
MTLPRSDRRMVLALLCLASFASVFNNLIIAPLLPEIADEFNVRVSTAGFLVTLYAIAGAAAGFFSGPFIDRLGRKPVVLTGMTIVVVATALSAVAPNFLFLAGTRALAGLGVACLSPAVFSAVGDYFSYEERGRAMSWVVAANSSAGIIGVPAGAFVSGFLSWRFTFAGLAVLCLLFVVLLAKKLPRDAARTGPAGAGGLRSVPHVLGNRTALAAIASGSLSTAYFFVFLTYMGAYYHDEFGLPKWALGFLTMTQGLGILLGSAAGGRLSDRIGKRPVVIWSGLISGAFLAVETVAAPHWAIGGLFILLFAIFGGARFASSQAVLTELMPGRRGTVMSLGATGQQLGIVIGSFLGGRALDTWGYTALGPTAFAVAALSTLIFWANVHERGAAPTHDDLPHPAAAPREA